jgi:hypothetical protein
MKSSMYDVSYFPKRITRISDDPRALLRSGFLSFCAASTVLWLILYGAYVAFPYVRNGADIISQEKVRYLETQPVFSATAHRRILVFGDSKILAGFDPAIYGEAFSSDVESFNAGRPANSRFVVLLKQILARGTRPTHIFVEVPPADERETSWLDYLRHDKKLVELLFPFRNLPRDLTLFLFQARHNGVIETYKENGQTAERVLDDKGYYFIKAQSLFPDDRLPDNYRLPTDSATRALPRVIDPKAPAFQDLVGMAATYGFAVVFIPTPYRAGEFAPASDSDKSEGVMPIDGVPGFYVAGPSHWLYEPKYFSDPVHLNKEGATLYSRRLATTTASLVNATVSAAD